MKNGFPGRASAVMAALLGLPACASDEMPAVGSGADAAVATSGTGNGGGGVGSSEPTGVGGTSSGGSAGSGAESGSGGTAGSENGTAGAPGKAGQSAGGASSPPITDAGSYVVIRDPNAPGILLHVRNDCAFDLWIHAAGKGAVLTPDNQRLVPGSAQDYLAPDEWPAARVTAYGSAPNARGQPQQELDKVEMTLGKKVINYNITYVDWLALPVEMVGLGSGKDCKRVGCYLPAADVAARCPDGLLSGKRCLSAGNYCSNAANQGSVYCHALDARIEECASDQTKYPGCAAAGATTRDVYGCAGFFGSSPKWCAALNRGMLSDPDNGDISLYYQDAPFNTYSKWVHSVCPGIYAFPYDDYGKTNESGFHACTGGTELNITFCPAG